MLKKYWRLIILIISLIISFIHFLIFDDSQHFILSEFLVCIFIYLMSHLLFPNRKVSQRYAQFIGHVLAIITGISMAITLVPEIIKMTVYLMSIWLLGQGVLNDNFNFSIVYFTLVWCIIDLFLSVIMFLCLTRFEMQGSLHSKWTFKTLFLFILIPSLITILKCFLNIYNNNYVGGSALVIILLLMNDMALLDYHRISMELKHSRNDNSCKCKNILIIKYESSFKKLIISRKGQLMLLIIVVMILITKRRLA